MLSWIKKLFRRKYSETDMRRTPVDSPLDYREDGSIREGDPAYDMMMEALRTGNPVISTQRKDGTWKTEEVRPSEN